MSRRVLITTVVTAAIAVAGIAGAASDQKRFERAIKKYGMLDSELQATDEIRPKGMCVCLEVGGDNHKAGFLLWADDFDPGKVFCMVPNDFAPDGSYTGSSSCGDWVPLAK